MKGQAYIVGVRDVLSNHIHDPRERLRHASQMLWQATFYEETWPNKIRRAAAELIDRLLAHGPITHTIDTLDASQVRVLLDKLDEFAAAFEHEQGKGGWEE